MSSSKISVKDALYEAPGPKTRKIINISTGLSLAAIAALLYIIIKQFIITGQLDAKYWSFFTRITTWRFLGAGLLGTFEAAIISGIMAMAAGFFIMLCRISKLKPLNYFARAYTEFTRGVPTLLFIYFFFLAVPQFGLKLAAIWKITIPVAISASGVVAEVLRTGVNAVPKGQREAALSLGMSDSLIFFKIIFPQAIRYVIPSLIAELVIVVKDTTYAYVINFPDLMQNAKVLISNYDAMLSVYLVVAIIYILINYFLNKLAQYFNKKSMASVNI
ncbi:MAG: amino acid ABC transporter permease [Lachnospiraceae bacterium]|nr:amino acid ABC transporter permease [Lachnospiraceae bacterium]